MKKVVIFRKFAREATKNSHAAIKGCWMILFTGGTLALLRSFDELIECKFPLLKSGLSGIHCNQSIDNFSFFLSLSLFIVYILTFYRFYVGNIRVFDIRYDEVFKFIDSLHDEKNQQNIDQRDPAETLDYHNLLHYSDSLIKRESIYLIVPTLIIVYLTVTPLNPFKFLCVYLLLLLLDIVWLIWNLRFLADAQHDHTEYLIARFFEVFPELKETGFDKTFPKRASRTWSINNSCFAIIILAILIAYFFDFRICSDWTDISNRQFLLAAGALAALANCILDLLLTWKFYNPKFGEAQDIVVRKSGS
jgi:hypothetical protein